MKYYLDTSIWRDYYEGREDNLKPIGEFAFKFIKYCVENDFKILISDLIIYELKKDYSDEKIKSIFSIIKKESNLIKIIPSDEQIEEAKKLDKIRRVGVADCIHAIVARDNGAILVTRDKHYLELLDICEIKKPEDLF